MDKKTVKWSTYMNYSRLPLIRIKLPITAVSPKKTYKSLFLLCGMLHRCIVIRLACPQTSTHTHTHTHTHTQSCTAVHSLGYKVQKDNAMITTLHGWLVCCLASQQHASVSRGQICSGNFTCCHTEIEVADQTFYLTQSQYTDTGPTSPNTDPVRPGSLSMDTLSSNITFCGRPIYSKHWP